MKSSYKLIGAYWDHAPLPQEKIFLIPFDPTYLPASSPLCLFDLIEKKRRIGITELLTVESDAQLAAMSDGLSDCVEVAVLLDYQPSAPGNVPRRFYRRRVLQAYARLLSTLPGSKLVFMLPEERSDVA
jgi:hypothetical protein